MIDMKMAGQWRCGLPAPLGYFVIQHGDGAVFAADFEDAPSVAERGPLDAEPSRQRLAMLDWLQGRGGPLASLEPFVKCQGTPFQREVWLAIQSIPRGQVLTYQALAARIGRPSATRAVAAACAANRLAVFVPCHRVVASNGSLAGFRWGVERKAALLALEGVSLTAPVAGR